MIMLFLFFPPIWKMYEIGYNNTKILILLPVQIPHGLQDLLLMNIQFSVINLLNTFWLYFAFLHKTFSAFCFLVNYINNFACIFETFIDCTVRWIPHSRFMQVIYTNGSVQCWWIKGPYIYDACTEGGLMSLEICQVFVDSFVFKQYIYFTVLQMEGWGSLNWSFFVDVQFYDP